MTMSRQSNATNRLKWRYPLVTAILITAGGASLSTLFNENESSIHPPLSQKQKDLVDCLNAKSPHATPKQIAQRRFCPQ